MKTLGFLRFTSQAGGHNYLIEHSAGSGKSNTIGWLTHRLASLHDEHNQRVFDSVIVVTDRIVLDQQLQDRIYQFEHKRGVVQKIDESSRQLAEAANRCSPPFQMARTVFSGRLSPAPSSADIPMEMPSERAAFALVYFPVSPPHQAGRQVIRGLHRIS